MPLLDILLYPDPRLRKKSAAVEKIDASVCSLLDDMAETMREAKGIGLAAPQVGANIRVIVVCDFCTVTEENGGGDAPDEEGRKELPVIEMINPVISSGAGTQEGSESCLSIPDFSGEVRRKLNIEVEWLGRNGKKQNMKTDGLTSRVIQHETDHLDGILFVDRLKRLQKEIVLKKMNKTYGKPVKTPR